jgi:hypothetical protein
VQKQPNWRACTEAATKSSGSPHHQAKYDSGGDRNFLVATSRMYSVCTFVVPPNWRQGVKRSARTSDLCTYRTAPEDRANSPPTTGHSKIKSSGTHTAAALP